MNLETNQYNKCEGSVFYKQKKIQFNTPNQIAYFRLDDNNLNFLEIKLN